MNNSLEGIRFFRHPNSDLNNIVKKEIEYVITHLGNVLNGDIVSIILSGSLSRGEGIWKRTPYGNVVYSDIDLLVILNKTLQNSIANDIIIDINTNTKVRFDIKFVPYKSLKKLPRNSHVLDWKLGITVYGENVISEFPKVSKFDIGIKDIIFLFFNRILLTLKGIKPLDKSNTSLIFLSHEASKTLFTCADFLTIYFDEYYPSIIHRINAVRDIITSINIPYKTLFWKSLKKALQFRFSPDLLYYNDAINFWLISKKILIEMYKYILTYHGYASVSIEDLAYNSLKNLIDLSFKKKILTLANYMKRSVDLAVHDKDIPMSIFYCGNCPINNRMAALMLYLSISKESILDEYVHKAINYLPQNKKKNYNSTTLNILSLWNITRNQIIYLLSHGFI